MLEDLLRENLALVVTASATFVFIGVERAWPNRRTPFDAFWVLRALGLAASGVVLTALLGNGFAAQLRSVQLFPALALRLAALPEWLDGFAAYVVVTFFVYWWHRARHASPLLWRIFHQVHHSPHRIEALTAFYAHPADFLANTLIVNFVAYCLLGLPVGGAVWTAIWVGVFELWEHTNIRTPRWLGYIVVRPEMHRVHHERERHARNYAIPVWDMLFRTYENSLRDVDCGFEPDEERRLGAMLAGRDVHR